jgi:hypothetical protein
MLFFRLWFRWIYFLATSSTVLVAMVIMVYICKVKEEVFRDVGRHFVACHNAYKEGLVAALCVFPGWGGGGGGGVRVGGDGGVRVGGGGEGVLRISITQPASQQNVSFLLHHSIL